MRSTITYSKAVAVSIRGSKLPIVWWRPEHLILKDSQQHKRFVLNRNPTSLFAIYSTKRRAVFPDAVRVFP